MPQGGETGRQDPAEVAGQWEAANPWPSQGPCQVGLKGEQEMGCLSLLVLPGVPAPPGIAGSYVRGTAHSHGGWARGGHPELRATRGSGLLSKLMLHTTPPTGTLGVGGAQNRL